LISDYRIRWRRVDERWKIILSPRLRAMQIRIRFSGRVPFRRRGRRINRRSRKAIGFRLSPVAGIAKRQVIIARQVYGLPAIIIEIAPLRLVQDLHAASVAKARIASKFRSAFPAKHSKKIAKDLKARIAKLARVRYFFSHSLQTFAPTRASGRSTLSGETPRAHFFFLFCREDRGPTSTLF
jgi:hypothetical protein